MKLIKKFIMALLFFVCVLFSKNIYAKYNYIISMDAFSLNRDTSEILYTIEKNNISDEYINEDIIFKIIANKQIEPVEGFELDESKKILTRIISENENKKIILKDLSGNKKEVNYSISNIDKEPPEILGIENGITYTEAKKVDYTDNVGIKEIKIDKYGERLKINCFEHFYDSGYYKGLDVLSNQIYIDVVEHPKGTSYYKFYLNNQLKATTEKSEYTFTGLSTATTYNVKIEAINENGVILDSVTKSIKTKCFKSISTKKEGDNFYVKIYGIDSRVSAGYLCLWKQNSSIQKYSYPQINADRSMELSFNAYDVDGNKSYGYYYFHLQLFNNSDSNLNEIVVMNVIFNEFYTKIDDDNLDPYNLNRNGNYEIIVTDLAGNISKKNCIIKY